MSTLPTGTLTLLFSDIEGSTALLHELGDQWGAALSAQRAIMRAAFTAHDGIEMGTEGDSFFVVFTSAQHAVLAAITAQRDLQRYPWPDGATLRVRMGIHTGEPQRHEDGYIGEDVHRAARIGSAAHGGQIVLSSATARLLPVLPDVSLRDLGHHRLKDLAGDDQLFDVVVPDLLTEFGALRSLGRVAALPAWSTPFVGREGDVATLRELVSDPATRLVTVTGPGGSGKTRLAVATAAVLEPSYSDGVYFIGLSAAVDVASAWLLIGEALDVGGGDTDSDRAVAVIDRLRGRRALLLLDNVEQIAGADTLVSALLAGASRIDLLVCSRRPVLLVGEREYPLATLALPESADLESVRRSPAVVMFTQYARLVRPTFELTSDSCGAVAELVRRVDGLPLAIELAAAQTRLLTASALLSRIDGTLGRSFGATDRPPRQRTLDDVIGWSYDLLSDEDRTVFRCVGVFEGAVELDAISAVSGDAAGTLDAVARLVTASVVRVVEGMDHEPRVSMLQTIRAFARSRLDETGEGVELRMRHLTWCADSVERAVPGLGGRLHTVARDRLDALQEDIRAALRFALDPSLPPDAERLRLGHQLLITVTTRYWYRFGSVDEARHWQERALAAGDVRDSNEHIGLLFGLGVSELLHSAVPAAVERLTQALEMSRRLDHRGWEARILNTLAVARRQEGEFAQALDLLQAALGIARAEHNEDIEAKSLGNLAVIYHDLGDHEHAARAAAQSRDLNIGRGDDWAVVIDEINYTAAILHTQGAGAAARHLAGWVPALLAFGETELVIDAVELAGAIAAGLGSATVAAQLLGCADSRRSSNAMPRSSAEAGRVDGWAAGVRDVLSGDEWRAAYGTGDSVELAHLGEIMCAVATPS